MSDTYFRYVPKDPSFAPTVEASANGVRFLQEHLPAEGIAGVVSNDIEFMDAGENWEGVTCSSCGANAEAWWGEAMSKASETQFKSLNVKAVCCGEIVSLNELQYGWPIAFGRYALEATNPDGQGLSQNLLAQLGQVLGCEVREIRALL